MKNLFTLAIMLFIANSGFAQQMNLVEWNELAKTNFRLLPKYGHVPKTPEQKKADNKFIEATIQQEQFKGDTLAASNHMIGLGFNYLYRGDLKTAMYRFNQAYLLDSLNSEIYWGYGAIYMALGDYGKARLQYEEGLSQNPNNTHLLTDFGTYYLAQYFATINMPANEIIKNPKEQAATLLDSSLIYLNKSYQIDSKDQNTVFKLSTSYYYQGNCENAWKFYDECKALGGKPITESYTKDLKKKCKR